MPVNPSVFIIPQHLVSIKPERISCLFHYWSRGDRYVGNWQFLRHILSIVFLERFGYHPTPQCDNSTNYVTSTN
jgi:hypothetical protein